MAQRWGLRAAVLGGHGGGRAHRGPVAGRAEVEVVWRNTMGVRHPDDARCDIPVLDPAELAAAGAAAVGPAAAAYRRALEAAVAHGGDLPASAEVEAGLGASSVGCGRLERHRIPSLEEALATCCSWRSKSASARSGWSPAGRNACTSGTV